MTFEDTDLIPVTDAGRTMLLLVTRVPGLTTHQEGGVLFVRDAAHQVETSILIADLFEDAETPFARLSELLSSDGRPPMTLRGLVLDPDNPRFQPG